MLKTITIFSNGIMFGNLLFEKFVIKVEKLKVNNLLKGGLTMKKIGNLIFAAVLGSAITLGTFKLVSKEESKVIRIEHLDATPVKGVAYTVNERGELAPLSFTDAAEKVMPAVVHIRSTQTRPTARNQNQQQIPDAFRDFFNDDFFERFFGPRFQEPDNRRGTPQPRMGSGSGVIISSDGYIVTNNHVIANADDIEVTLHDNRSYKASVIGKDPTTDIAVVKINQDNLPALPFSDSDHIRVGEWVLAVGNPFNLNSTVTAGIVSAKGRSINILRESYAIESFIQTDAAINPGNSGGALVNLNGGLVGINTAIASPTGSYAGYGFAVPSNLVSKVVEDLLKFGTVQRGVLGVGIINVNSQLITDKALKLSTHEGVYVDSVYTNSAAEGAGIRVGDVIQEVNGTPVRTSAELIGIIGRHRPGDEVQLKINREGKKRDVSVKLKNLQGTTELVAKEVAPKAAEILGAELANVDRQTARRLRIDGGVEVKKLNPGKLRNSNMQEGFIITKIDGRPVRSVEDVNKAIDGKKGGVMVEGMYPDEQEVKFYAFGL
jgi:serine protease Do